MFQFCCAEVISVLQSGIDSARRKMYVGHLCVLLLLVVFNRYGQSLVCYDNVTAGEPVLIECSYAGAVCAVTNKTTTTRLRRHKNSTEYELLYHCAQKSCKLGPLSHCTSESNVECKTRCCSTDKCNAPLDESIKVQTVPANEARGCYQLIENDQERVKCLFKDARCLYVEIAPRYTVLSTDRSISQLCSTKSLCEEFESYCAIYNQDQRFSWNKKTCTAKCCSSNYCNPLPYNTHYEGGDSGHEKDNDGTYHINHGSNPSYPRSVRGGFKLVYLLFLLVIAIPVSLVKCYRCLKTKNDTEYTVATLDDTQVGGSKGQAV